MIAENVPNLRKETDFQIQEAQRTPDNINKSRPTPRCSVIKLTNYGYKEKILKAVRQKKSLTYKEKPRRLVGDFSTETWQARRERHDLVKVLNGKHLQPRILQGFLSSVGQLSMILKYYHDKKKKILPIQQEHHSETEGERKRFPDKQKLREFISTKTAQEEILKRIF